MRQIPIYDISNTEEFKHDILQWQGFIDRNTAEYYCEIIRRKAKCGKLCHLEISQNSPNKIGRRLRTASLSLLKGEKEYSSESIYQGSKVFSKAGSQHQIYEKTGGEALKIKSGWKGRKIKEINLFGTEFPTEALSDLHDIVYWLGLERKIGNLKEVLSDFERYKVFFFTDCFDSVGKNSQAKSFAFYFWKFRRKERVWDHLTENQQRMFDILSGVDYAQSGKIEYLN